MALTRCPEPAGHWLHHPQEMFQIHLLASEQVTLLLHAGKEAGRRVLNPPGPATPPKTKPTSGSETLLDQNTPGRSGFADTKSDALNHRDAHLASDHPLIRDPIRGIQLDLSLRAPSMPLETPFPYQYSF